ncbi:alanyl-tRNA editing protein [Roseomonas sp. GC11]|uniref:alanyl-tRNA editing protein n=1 Tax=Roseomonas sp. GC11 TaxID=2950546 RepID=UPI00210A6508|nr:alanyl-tRNA editing protein [Roseomonas sp. GC11]MCQ4159005.1 alanyl-tRNA editing protein [Roseomonas sp. GC11]
MTELLYRADAYRREATAVVLSAGPEGVVLDRTPFYAQAGGQPGDTGWLRWAGGEMAVANTVKGEGATLLHLPAPDATHSLPPSLPPVGASVTAVLDWARRHRLMRMHTSLHLLCSLIPGAGVTGGQIGLEKSRLDFDLPEPPTKEWLTEKLTALAAASHAVSERWITEAELDANPGLVRTLSVQPPRGAGQVRLVCIGDPAAPVDLQPCGGTHVRDTAEIGAITITKLENKGKQNRRVYLTLEG